MSYDLRTENERREWEKLWHRIGERNRRHRRIPDYWLPLYRFIEATPGCSEYACSRAIDDRWPHKKLKALLSMGVIRREVDYNRRGGPYRYSYYVVKEGNGQN